MFRRTKRLVFELEKRGLIGGITWLLVTIKRKIVPGKQIIWRVELSEIDEADFQLPDNIEVRRFRSEGETDEVILNRLIKGGTELMGSDARKMIERRFENGAVLWVVMVDGTIAGYKWTIVKDPLKPTFIPHTEKDVHGIGGEMFKAFRGRNLFQIFTKYKLITLKKEGYSRFYSETYLWNKSAIKAILRTDYCEIGIARKLRLFGRNIVFWYEMVNRR